MNENDKDKEELIGKKGYRKQEYQLHHEDGKRVGNYGVSIDEHRNITTRIELYKLQDRYVKNKETYIHEIIIISTKKGNLL